MKITDAPTIIIMITAAVFAVAVFGFVMNQTEEQPLEMFPGYTMPENTSAAYQILVNALPEEETPAEPITKVQLPEPDYCWGGSTTSVDEEPETEEPVEVYNPHKAQWNNIQNNVFNGQSMSWY